MGRYYEMVKANYNKLRNDEGVMWGGASRCGISTLRR